MTKYTGNLEADTCLIPEIIADSIVREGAALLPALQSDEALVREVADGLASKAYAIYTKNKSFARNLRKNDGRDVLYSFMRHWLSAVALQRWNIRMPAHFANGLPLNG